MTLTIADLLLQRVDKVGPIDLENSSDQPPERAQKIMDAPDVDAASPADVDTPNAGSTGGGMGFQAATDRQPHASGTSDPGGGDEEEGAPDVQAGGGSEPAPPDPQPDPFPDDDDDDDTTEVRCAFRSMRPSDQPTCYELERDRDDQ